MNCEQARQDISAYLDHELPPAEADAVRAHLEACPDCRALLEELRTMVDLVGRLPERPAPVGLSEDVRREVQRRSVLARTGVGRRARHPAAGRPVFLPRALALAASFLLAAGIGTVLYLDATHPGGRGLFAFRGATGREAALDKTRLGQAEHEEKEMPLAIAPPSPARPPAGVPGEADAERSVFAGKAFDVQKPAAAPAKAYRPAFDYSVAAGPESGPIAPQTPAAVQFERSEQPQAPALDSNGRLRDKAGQAGQGASAAPDSKDARQPAADGWNQLGLTPGNAADTGRVDATVTVLADKAKEVQQVMNSAAFGQASIQSLSQVASGGNLARADNQLILEVESRDKANAELVELFRQSGWSPVGGRERAAGRSGAPEATVAKRSGGEGETGGQPPAAGYFFLAHRDGEDTWVVIADRDDVSRFGSRLAGEPDLAVAYDSSEPFVAIRRLQDRLAVRAADDLGRDLGQKKSDSFALARKAEDEKIAVPPAERAPGAAPTEGGLKADVQVKAHREERLEDARRPALAEADATARPPDVEQKDALAAGQSEPASSPAASFYSWSDGTLRPAAPLPENQVLLVIRVRWRPEAPPTVTADTEINASKEAAPADASGAATQSAPAAGH